MFIFVKILNVIMKDYKQIISCRIVKKVSGFYQIRKLLVINIHVMLNIKQQ